MSDHYDLLAVGAGPGGYIAALKGAQMGARVGIGLHLPPRKIFSVVAEVA